MSEMITKLWRRLPTRSRHSGTSALTPSQPVTGTIDREEDPASRLLNKETSDLLFIARVMDEAGNTAHPLLERVRFLAIASDVLDQFYAIRVAGMIRDVARRSGEMTVDGLTQRQQWTRCLDEARNLQCRAQDMWPELRALLKGHRIEVLTRSELTPDDRSWLKTYLRETAVGVLTPIVVDEEHPFPYVANGALCLLLELRERNILIPLPATLPRFINLPGTNDRYIAFEDAIALFWLDLYPGEALRTVSTFQLIRDLNLSRKSDSDDLREVVETGLRLRHKADVVQLNVASGTSEASLHFLAIQLGLFTRREIAIHQQQGGLLANANPVFVAALPGLSQLSEIINEAEHHDLVFPALEPRHPADFEDCFSVISQGDRLFHWPFDAFDTIVHFLNQAASDPDVLAIKQTLYRTSDDSPVIDALVAGAQAGKHVMAVIELEARESEASNVRLARRLEEAGVQIVYGIVSLKVHCKIALVIRREGDQTVAYAHASTGNYHPATAKRYTDLSLFTRDQTITRDVTRVFDYLSSGIDSGFEDLLVSPVSLRGHLVRLIDDEINHAQAGRPGRIVIKVNALTDPMMIEKFYEASCAGVSVDLFVRRQCRLRPGVPGMSSNISVRSTVGRFLEHSRIYAFGAGESFSAGTALLFIGSPDLMERNLNERVEVLLPVKDRDIRTRVIDGILHAYRIDDTQSWALSSAGQFERIPQKTGFDAQSFFINESTPEKLGPYPR